MQQQKVVDHHRIQISIHLTSYSYISHSDTAPKDTNETIIEGLERQLRVLDGYIADAQNEQDRLDAEWGKKEAKNIIAYMKKHTDKYPVAKPLEFCPLHPRSSAKIKP